jgi:PAS domain S-box-containing protein
MYNFYIEYKESINDLLTILMLVFGLVGAYKADLHKHLVWLWNKTVIPIWHRMIGTRETNRRLDELTRVVESSARAQSVFAQNIMHGMSELGDRMEHIAAEQNKIHVEITMPNGGGRMVDTLNKIAGVQWARDYEDDDAMILHTDANGSVTRVNRLLTRIVGRPESELLGSGWINTIAFEDRERVKKDWHDAVKNKRDYEGEYHIINSKGKSINVESRATRMVDGKGNVIGYYRRIRIKKE